MVRATPFLLVLFLALGAHGKKCNLTGDWKNDLGSNMTIYEVKENGDLTGTYLTSIIPPPLLGSQHLPDQLNQPTFGFTVHWNNSHASFYLRIHVVVFTGQCFVDNEGKEILKTMWLWRSHDNRLEDDWNATVGFGGFITIIRTET
uniref:Avidin n=1 Tax=Ficedula albicollis TaxID=59894 RepID=A0A803VB59_FICAL